MKKTLIVLGCILLVASMSYPVAAADSVKVGVVLPTTGSLAKFGEIEKNSFLMAQARDQCGGRHQRKKP